MSASCGPFSPGPGVAGLSGKQGRFTQLMTRARPGPDCRHPRASCCWAEISLTKATVGWSEPAQPFCKLLTVARVGNMHACLRPTFDSTPPRLLKGDWVGLWVVTARSIALSTAVVHGSHKTPASKMICLM